MAYIPAFAEPGMAASPHIDDLLGAFHGWRRLTPEQIVFDEDDARAVLRFFFGPTMPDAMTLADREFAQSLFLEAVDASATMTIPRGLFKSFFMKPPGLPAKSIRKALKIAMDYGLTRLKSPTLKDAEIFEMVRRTIAWKRRSDWGTRLQTGTYV